MALTKQVVPISFARGINTKIDDKQLPLGSFEVLENVIFGKIAEYRKRNGFDNVSLKLITGEDIQDPTSITKFLNELCLFNDTNFYSRAEGINKWVEKGTILNIFPTSTPILRNTKEQKNLDVAFTTNTELYVYEDSEGVKLSAVDSETKNFLQSDLLVSASGTLPRITNIGNTAFIFYTESNEIKYRSFNIIDPENLGTETVLISTLSAINPKFDVLTIDNKVAIAFQSNANLLSLLTLDESEVASSIIGITGESAAGGLSLSTDSLSKIVITYYDNTDVKITSRTLNLSTEMIAPTSIETIADVNNIETVENDTGYTVVYEVGNGPSYNTYIKSNTISTGAVIGTPSVLYRSLGLASKIFKKENKSHFLTIHESELQSSYFLVTTDGEISSKISANIGGDLISENGVPHVPSIDSNNFLITSQIKGRTVTDDGTFYSLLGVNSTVINFALKDPYQNERMGQNLHIASGYLHMYDGNKVVEHGFHLFPENLSAGSTNTVGGSLSDGQRQYIAVYSWTDNKGQQHRSAPSIPITVTLSGGTSTQIQNVVVPSLRLTNKEDVVLELYRTEAAGTVFYKVTDVQNPDLNDKTVDSITILDTISDTDLIDNELLYNTGGVLDNISAPSSSIITSYKNRIFLAGLEDENSILFSKIRSEGTPVEFNDTLTRNINPEGGRITALKTLDDKLIIFKESSIYFIAGDGPNNLGELDSFIDPERVSGDIGCIDTNSVVLSPIGIFFKSRKGIYLLGRDLTLNYIGAPVERYNSQIITSAEILEDKDQIRFTTNDGVTLMYDLLVQQWSTFKNNEGLAATVLNNNYYYLRPDGYLYKENKNSYSDNGTSIDTKIKTGWISLAGMQGFKRVYKLLLLGEFKSKHKLKISVSYDYAEADVQDVIIDTSDFTSSSKYGQESPYGSEATYGNLNQYQIRIHLKKQLCQAIKIEISDIQDEEIGESLVLSNLALEVGVRSGAAKIGQNRTYGTDSQ